MGFSASHGVLVIYLAPTSVAGSAGVVVGDVVLQIEDTPIEQFCDVNLAIAMIIAGSKVPVRAQRARSTLTLQAQYRRKCFINLPGMPSSLGATAAAPSEEKGNGAIF